MSRDYGIKISKPGFDATTAADADLLFSSSWPSLPIANEATFTGQSSSFTFEHGLGFPCFAIIWEITSAGLSSQRYLTRTRTDSTYVYIDSPTSTNSYHVKCYNIDLSTSVEYPLLNTSSVDRPYDPSYGIKIAKEGEDIDSSDLRDFILHSRAQSPLVLTVQTASGVSTTNTYNDPQGYTSWVFGFTRTSGGIYTHAAYYSQAYPRLFITTTGGTNTYSITTSSTDDSSTILVLRDPMFAPTNLNVTY